MTIGFQNHDPAHTGFQFLEDLSTAYWYSQVLFTALELELFRFLDQESGSADDLAMAADCRPHELARLLKALAVMGLVACDQGKFHNTQIASFFLVPGKKGYMGDFFLYRQYLQPQWDKLTPKILGRKQKPVPPLSYEDRNFKYVASMDSLVRQKALEIAGLLASQNLTGPLLDIGGGAGSLARALRKSIPGGKALVFDIAEVIEAALRLYPDPDDWEGITTLGGDFRTHEFNRKFALVCLSNFLHAYGPEEARQLLFKAISLVAENGLLLIHDYFPDRKGASPQKGALYDLNMMLNTYNGACHDSKTLMHWCAEAGLETVGVQDLGTDTAVILARHKGSLGLKQTPLPDFALELGLEGLIPVSPGEVVTAPWAREKCRFGCLRFGQGLQCPPQGMDHEKTRQILDSYTSAFLVRGAPPGKTFHQALLSLEKKAFLEGYHKAFVFGAGPCTVCPECPQEGLCRYPHLARPSMEGSGIDVYTTAARAGVPLKPVQKKGWYITYMGLLLME